MPPVVFKPLKLSFGGQGKSSLREQYTAYILEQDKSLQKKIHEFETATARQSQQQLNQIKQQEEQRKQLLQHYDQAAKLEKQWLTIVNGAQKYIHEHMAVFSDVQHTLTSYFDVNRIKAQGIEAILLDLQDDLVRDDGVPPAALRHVVELFKYLHLPTHPSFVTYSDALYALYTNLSEVTKAITERVLNKPLKDLKETSELLNKLTSLIQQAIPTPPNLIQTNTRAPAAGVVNSIVKLLQEQAQGLCDQVNEHVDRFRLSLEANVKGLAVATQKTRLLFPRIFQTFTHYEDFYRKFTERYRKYEGDSQGLDGIFEDLMERIIIHPPRGKSTGHGSSIHNANTNVFKLPLYNLVGKTHYLATFFASPPFHSSPSLVKHFILRAVTTILDTILAMEGSENGSPYVFIDHAVIYYTCILCTYISSLGSKDKLYWQQVVYATLLDYAGSNILPSFINTQWGGSSGRPIAQKILLYKFFASCCAYLSYSSLPPYSPQPFIAAATAASAPFTPFSAEGVFIYLQECVAQIAYSIYYTHVQEGNERSLVSPINNQLYALHIFLTYTLPTILTHYYESRGDLLNPLITLLTQPQNSSFLKSYNKLAPLLNLLQEVVKVGGKGGEGRYVNFQMPYVPLALLHARHYESLSQSILLLEADKTVAFMQYVKSQQIDRIRSIFNRLSVTTESQTLVIAQLEETLKKAYHYDQQNPPMNDMTMAQYVLHKVVMNICRDIQEEFFNEMDKPNVHKIYVVVQKLSAVYGNTTSSNDGKSDDGNVFSEYLLSACYAICPLLVPRIIPEGVSDGSSGGDGEGAMDSYFLSLGYLKKANNTLEGEKTWLARMRKLLTVYTYICTQPQQDIPNFNIHHLYAYMVRLTNVCSSFPKLVPEYIPSLYEVLVSVGSDVLVQVYGEKYLGLCKAILGLLQSKSEDDVPKKKTVETILKKFVDSRGKDWVSFFHKEEDKR
eukprot:gene25113-30332_t